MTLFNIYENNFQFFFLIKKYLKNKDKIIKINKIYLFCF